MFFKFRCVGFRTKEGAMEGITLSFDFKLLARAESESEKLSFVYCWMRERFISEVKNLMEGCRIPWANLLLSLKVGFHFRVILERATRARIEVLQSALLEFVKEHGEFAEVVFCGDLVPAFELVQEGRKG